MVFLLINLIQGQPAKASWLLWTVAGLFFLAGLALLIYLIVNAKKRDQLDDVEEGGIGGGLLSKEKLLDETEQKKSAAQEATPSPQPPPAEAAHINQTIPLFSEADFRKDAKAVEPEIASEPLSQAPLAAEPEPLQTIPELQAEPEIAADVPVAAQNPAPEIPQASPASATYESPDHSTQVLTSQTTAPIVEPATIPEPAIIPLAVQEEEIFSPQEEALFSQREATLAKHTPASTPPPTIALSSQTEESSTARVDTPVSQQRFEQSARPRREPFEPPTIEPLTPRPIATQELSSQASPSAVDESRDKRATTLNPQPGRKTTVMPSPVEIFSEPPGASPVDSGTLPLSSAQTSFKNRPQTKPQAAPVWEAQGAGTRAIERKPAGSVLGLPAEASNAPLIIGQPAHGRDEEGVAALTNYGKDLDATETGRGGAITLFIAILLIAGGALLYFYVPAVRSRADALVARIRGQQPAPVVVEKPKAQIYPSLSPEVNKNLVKARGAVTNISEEPLEELSVEVSLDRGEGTAVEVRTIAVKPNVLAPRQQGLYEFEYEGGKATGFSRYRVTKLLSKNGEVKFKTPNQ
jgi:hypothetical protein